MHHQYLKHFYSLNIFVNIISENFLEIQNGDFTASEKNKVNNVNLVIKKQGEIISLLGPSGIGKTTILRTLAGLQKLSNGKILLKGKIVFHTSICPSSANAKKDVI